jgi:hypothetical protein
MGNLALVLSKQGRYEEAEAMDREVLALRREVLGPEHTSKSVSLSCLHLVLSRQGRHEEASAHSAGSHQKG